MNPTVILVGMTHRVGPKGQVVIPKGLRDAIGIHPGDEVEFWLDGDHVVVRRAQDRPSLKGRFAGMALRSVLQSERKKDKARESRR